MGVVTKAAAAAVMGVVVVRSFSPSTPRKSVHG